MTNKEKAEKTYIILQQRRRDKERKAKEDFYGHAFNNLDRIYKKNYHGKRRRGEI